MKKRILWQVFLIISIIIAVISFVAYICSEYAEIGWLSSSIAFIFPSIISLINYIIGKIVASKNNWKFKLKKLIKNKEIKPDQYIRISFAYLFRIYLNGKYLLVQNERDIKKYQPVGGVYKCYAAEKDILTTNKYNIVDDDFIKIDETSKDDYRMRVPANKLIKFFKRFNKTNDRENISDISREFKEELILKNILKSEVFNKIKYKYIGRDISDLKYSKYNECYELLIADIVELIPNEKQEKELKLLQNTKTKKYYWATENEIKSEGIVKGTTKMNSIITDHSYKILQNNTTNLKSSKFTNIIYTVEIFKK